MPTDDDADDDDYVAPLPPDDRLWRHPSEVGSDAGAGAPQIVLVSKSGPALGRTLLVAGLAGLVGAMATLGVIVGTDAFVRERPGSTALQRESVESGRVPGKTELEVADSVLPAVARVEAVGAANGVVNSTAVVYRSDGHLITTADAVDAADSITVFLNDGAKLPAQLVSRSIDSDIAVLKIERTDLPVAVVSQQRSEFGERPIMIDASNASRGPEIFVGVVTKESTRIDREGDSPVYGLIQTNTRSTIGTRSAGTVLINEAGAVTGLITSRAEGNGTAVTPTTADESLTKVTTSDDTNALHFALPADFAWDIAGQLTDTGQIIRPWLGIRPGRDLTIDEANQRDLPGGVWVTGLEAGSPVQVGVGGSRLRVNDIIVGIDDEIITNYNDLVVATRRLKPGNQVTVTYLREGELNTPNFTVSGKPELP